MRPGHLELSKWYLLKMWLLKWGVGMVILLAFNTLIAIAWILFWPLVATIFWGQIALIVWALMSCYFSIARSKAWIIGRSSKEDQDFKMINFIFYFFLGNVFLIAAEAFFLQLLVH